MILEFQSLFNPDPNGYENFKTSLSLTQTRLMGSKPVRLASISGNRWDFLINFIRARLRWRCDKEMVVVCDRWLVLVICGVVVAIRNDFEMTTIRGADCVAIDTMLRI